MDNSTVVTVKKIDWIPVSAACKKLRCSRQRIHQLIEQGVLNSIKVNNTVLISNQDVEDRYMLTKGMRGWK